MRAWARARELAAATPASRNRYVDFLRAVSIALVVFGHWVAAAPYLDEEGKLRVTHALAIAPWTHYLTWGIQVMPIFFLVGGFANGVSWRAARKAGRSYAFWLEGRLRRLVVPVLALIVVWIGLAAGAHLAGVPASMIGIGSQMALIPTWFLAVYLAIAVCVPVTHALWERFGVASIVGLILCAGGVDALAIGCGLEGLGWLNYLFVWSAIHQLGYAWRDGRWGGSLRCLAVSLLGLGALVLALRYGPYPTSMVGVPGDDLSNTTPPKVSLIALALFQAGLLLALERPLRRWLARLGPWSCTVLVNGQIMTVFLWHMTAMVLVVGLAHLLGDPGFGPAPASGAWWALKPVWFMVWGASLVPFLALFAGYERPRAVPEEGTPAAWRLCLGALVISAGLAFLAYGGVAGSGPLGLRLGVLALPFAGALLVVRRPAA